MTPEDHAKDQAAAQYVTIAALLAAVECDYEYLEELRQLKAAAEILAGELFELPELPELASLEAQANGCTSEDDAHKRIQEHPLEITVRSDWAKPGEDLTPGEFQILLCTGGPAVRIVGDLDRGEPVRAWLEYQDWGTPWTTYFSADSETLCQYARHFYFGE